MDGVANLNKIDARYLTCAHSRKLHNASLYRLEICHFSSLDQWEVAATTADIGADADAEHLLWILNQ